jgi:hypothetical protein
MTSGSTRTFQFEQRTLGRLIVVHPGRLDGIALPAVHVIPDHGPDHGACRGSHRHADESALGVSTEDLSQGPSQRGSGQGSVARPSLGVGGLRGAPGEKRSQGHAKH